MNYGFSFKNTRPKSSIAMQTFRFALFVAFFLWLLYYYQIKQSSTKQSVNGESFSVHLNNQRISSVLGRKARVTPLKLTHRVKSNVILDDTTNPGELNDGFHEQEVISTEVLTTKSNDHELNDSEEAAYRFLDENGIPELVREKLVGNESTQSGNETRV